MSTVAAVLSHKNAEVLTIRPDASALEAISNMEKSNVGSILITDAVHSLLGIFTERDFLRRIVLKDRDPNTTHVGDVMSQDLITAEPRRSVMNCMSIMTNHFIRYLPVVENGQLVGIVSIGDLVRHLCVERGIEVKNLTDYITGRYPGEVGIGFWQG